MSEHGWRFAGALSLRGDKFFFPFLDEMYGVTVQSTEMLLLLGFDPSIMILFFFFLLSPLLEAVCQRTSVIISPFSVVFLVLFSLFLLS